MQTFAVTFAPNMLYNMFLKIVVGAENLPPLQRPYNAYRPPIDHPYNLYFFGIKIVAHSAKYYYFSKVILPPN